MTKATPAQIRVFRRRRLVTILGSIGILILGFLIGLILLALSASRKHHVPMPLSIVSVIFVWLGVSVLKSAYFRCPICGHPIPNQGGGSARSGTFGTRCDKCDVSFQGEAFLTAERRCSPWLLVLAISLFVLIGGFWLFMVIL